MADPVDKVIVTNQSALRAKHKASITPIRRAIAALIEADSARGMRTRFIALDDARAMGRLKTAAVTKPTSLRQNKAAIDGVCAALCSPNVLILGAGDVVPFQRLANPTYDRGGDPDEFVASDLPYACSRGYSEQVAAFLQPERAVGRLPDFLNSGDPEPLLNLLLRAAEHTTSTLGSFDPPLVISTQSWRVSTALSVRAVYGSDRSLQESPPSGPGGIWPPDMLLRRIHFLNCHGASADSHFYGQDARSFPIAHASRQLPGRIQPGTIVAAECCYGAELFDIAQARGEAPICQTYMREGAAAFFGSTTIAYGPADTNDAADLVCQIFLRYVLAGASLGRAVLEARREFLATRAPLDPYNAKTLAQFYLLGDPTLTPVEIPRSTRALQSFEPTPMSNPNTAKSSLTALCSEPIAVAPPPRIKTALLETMGSDVRARPRIRSFQAGRRQKPGVKPSTGTIPQSAKNLAVRFYCATAPLEGRGPRGTKRLRVVIATERGGEFSMHALESKGGWCMARPRVGNRPARAPKA